MTLGETVRTEYKQLREVHRWHHREGDQQVRAATALQIARGRATVPAYNVRAEDARGNAYESTLDVDAGPGAVITVTVHDDDYYDGVDDFDCCSGVSPCGFGVEGVDCQYGRDRDARHECRHKCEAWQLAESEGVYWVSVSVENVYLGELVEGGSVGGFVGFDAVREGIRELAADGAAMLADLGKIEVRA